jgi:WD40 repeat protein
MYNIFYPIIYIIYITNIIFKIHRGKQLVSGGEDGTVRLWDLRTKENTNILQPHLYDKVARPIIGKWIGAVDFTDDWLVCFITILF